MTENAPKDWLAILLRTIAWTAILMVVPAGAQLLSGLPPGGSWTFWTALEAFTAFAGLFLPFAAFGGGLAAAEPHGPGCEGCRGVGNRLGGAGLGGGSLSIP